MERGKGDCRLTKFEMNDILISGVIYEKINTCFYDHFIWMRTYR
jgi:hypothetical protein